MLTERVGDSAFAGLWEFPGGKLEDGEATDAALKRELAEELGIEVTGYAHLLQVSHRYSDRSVLIDFFLVEAWRGRPEGRDGQTLRWAAIEALDAHTLLPADAPVIDALKEIFESGR